MTNLFELMMQAQVGRAPEQAQKAVEAVLPAFQMGLQKQSETVEGFQRMMATMAQAPFAAMHGAEQAKVPEQAAEQGNDVLAQLFGGKEASRAVAAQAAMMSGISDQVMRQMLPIVASLLMGGLFKTATSGGLGGMFGPLMGGHPAYAPPAAPPANPFGDMMGQMLGGMMGQPAPPPPPPTPAEAGMDMLRGMFDAGQQAQKTQMEAFQRIFEQFSGRR